MSRIPSAPEPVTSRPALLARWGDDALVVWAAQGLDGASRAWTNGDAVAVAAPALSCRDRLVVAGTPDAAVELVRWVLPLVGPTFRPLAEQSVAQGLAVSVEDLDGVARFGWMEGRERPATLSDPAARWLDTSDDDEVASLLACSFPSSHARPGVPGVHRWAGVRAGDRLVGVGADAWSGPEVGFISGVATVPGARRAGTASAVCEFLIRHLLAERRAVGLFVNEENGPAIALYRRLGMAYRPVAALRQRAAGLLDPPGTSRC